MIGLDRLSSSAQSIQYLLCVRSRAALAMVDFNTSIYQRACQWRCVVRDIMAPCCSICTEVTPDNADTAAARPSLSTFWHFAGAVLNGDISVVTGRAAGIVHYNMTRMNWRSINYWFFTLIFWLISTSKYKYSNISLWTFFASVYHSGMLWFTSAGLLWKTKLFNQKYQNWD